MPELPEVETIKNALKTAIEGATITKTDIHCRRFRQEIPEDFEQKIQNGKILHCRRIAKYMILDLDNDYSIVWHLGMSGRAKITTEKSYDLQKHDHVVFYTDKGIVVFNDARRFGLMTYCQTNALGKHPFLTKVGIDPFDKEATGMYLFEQFRNKTTAVKIALLDQTLIGGIGNIYASEALYMARIRPDRPSKDLTLNECESLMNAVKNVLQKAINAGGSTLKDYRKLDGSLGYFQNMHCVYNKTGQRCPNCICDIESTKGIQKTVMGGRSTFYCATLQK